MRVGTIYSASDKALFDALNQKKVTSSDLRQLFLSRGVVISTHTRRKDLAEHFARLFHDYQDYQTLAQLFGSTTQRDKLTSVRVATEATLADFQSAAFELKAELEASGATVRVYATSGNRLDFEVKYTKVHFNKSEFRQVSTRNALVSIYQENGGFVIHSPQTEEAREWVDRVAIDVRERTKQDLKLDEIRLPEGMEPKVKTAFFTLLAKKLPELPLYDVSDVYVTKPQKHVEDGDVGATLIRIDKASLRGKGVLESDELALLQKKGFYVSRIVWKAKPELEPADVLEFEAQFSQPEECSAFTYLPRGFYRCTAPGIHSTTRTAFSQSDERKYGQMIEAAARSVILTLPGHSDEKV